MVMMMKMMLMMMMMRIVVIGTVMRTSLLPVTLILVVQMFNLSTHFSLKGRCFSSPVETRYHALHTCRPCKHMTLSFRGDVSML